MDKKKYARSNIHRLNNGIRRRLKDWKKREQFLANKDIDIIWRSRARIKQREIEGKNKINAIFRSELGIKARETDEKEIESETRKKMIC